MNSSHVKITMEVKAPSQEAWEIISDYAHAGVYNPLVKKTTLLSRNGRGVCAKRRCEFYDHRSVVEEVTLWIEGQGFTVQWTDTSMPFETAKVNIHVNSIDLFSSKVSMEMNYTVKFGFMGRFMDKLIIRKKITKFLSKVLTGLTRHMSTDHPPHAKISSINDNRPMYWVQPPVVNPG